MKKLIFAFACLFLAIPFLDISAGGAIYNQHSRQVKQLCEKEVKDFGIDKK